MDSNKKRSQLKTVECDRNMVACLLRNWKPNRLRAQGVKLSKERPRIIELQNGVCPLCDEVLVDHGKLTHLDHTLTVREAVDKIFRDEMTFDEAYKVLWDDANVRAVHTTCNYGRNKKNTEV
jgi:hypothetical protein